MSNWKYTDTTNQVVSRVNVDGSCESCLVSAITDWLSEGNTPDLADIPPIVIPTIISMKQARLALLGAGLLDPISAGISSMSRAVQIEWEFAATVDRASPLVQTLAAAFNLDSAALDTLFLGASTL